LCSPGEPAVRDLLSIATRTFPSETARLKRAAGGFSNE
jgi:hypothetical protein